MKEVSKSRPRFFRSLISRMLLLTMLSVIIAQWMSSQFWVSEFKTNEKKIILANANNLAENALSTFNFFVELPLKYRHLVLKQLRGLGGSRFFVSLNTEEIKIVSGKDSDLKMEVLYNIEKVLRKDVSASTAISLAFSDPDDLHVFKNDILLKDLPPSWGAYSLIIPTIKPPILVMQIEFAKDEWLYLATVMPPPYLLDDNSVLTPQQWVTLIFTTLLLLIFIYILFRWQTKPLRHLAYAVSEMSIDLNQKPLKEEGASEIVAATRAFNRMQQKLQGYINDRELLFRSISHDLKTPITRLRLRAELLDDEKQTDVFNSDLDDLELLVKGALQTVKETDIHENIEDININKLLLSISSAQPDKIKVKAKKVILFRGKPLALKRCLSNLIDNAVKYGQHADVFLVDSEHELQIIIQDSGPGIPSHEIAKIFAPYRRLHTDNKGHGLGLGISRNIVHAHNGELHLVNRHEGGLEVLISLPRMYKK